MVQNHPIDPSTEEKIKEAARRLFMEQGFAGTKTRDIAKEAGTNLALVNYYFRSKQNLFDIIMSERLATFMRTVAVGFNDTSTTLYQKIDFFVNSYITLLIEQPDLPLFIMTALRTDPTIITHKLGAKNVLLRSHFLQQYTEAVTNKTIAPIPPLHFIMNLFGMTVFPFVGRPFLQIISNASREDFNAMMEQRRTLVPLWLKALLEGGKA